MTEEQVQTEQAIVKTVAPSASYELAAERQIEELTYEMARQDLWNTVTLWDSNQGKEVEVEIPREVVMKAIHLAKARHANPWCDEMYIIPRWSKGKIKWTIQMSQNYVLKVATNHASCAGWQDGVIVQSNNGKIEELAGGFVPNGWKLVGSWFKGYRKGWQVPLIKRINLEEYNTNKSTWGTITPTMILKVARVQGLREMLPDRLGGMYESAEMDQMGDSMVPSLPSVPPTDESPPPQLPPATEPHAGPAPDSPPEYTPPPAPSTGTSHADAITEVRRMLFAMIGLSPSIVLEATAKKDPSCAYELVDENQITEARRLMVKWSSFKDQKGKKLDSTDDDRLMRGKWVFSIAGNAKKDYAIWLADNPELAIELEGE